jgi:eukaryotic-like serine/threonine-protein kinase
MMSSSLDASPLLEGITTFYSYKGGTGRSMALANVACLLGQEVRDSKNILVVDWDLEAPGQHYYLLDADQSDVAAHHLGIVDLFTSIQRYIKSSTHLDSLDDFFSRTQLSDYIMTTRASNVFLMPAGILDNDYQSRLMALDWQNMYAAFPDLYQDFAVQLSKTYQTVFIDSRTGMTDTSNICTSLLPDKLVVVFTPNRQNLTGVEALIRQSTEYRRRSADLRPLMVYPLPSRIDQQNESIRERWRRGDARRRIEGYEPQFERILKDAYGLADCSLERYFNLIQLQHSPEYSYGEPVVTLDPESSDRFSLLQSYKSLVDWLASSAAPWEDPQIGKDRKRLQSLRTQLEAEGTIHAGRDYIDTLRNIFDLTRRVNGENNLYTINAMQELVEASLIDNADRPSALDLLDKQIAKFKSLPSAYRCVIIESVFQSVGVLRGLKDDGEALRLRMRGGDLLDEDYKLSGTKNFGNLIAISERLLGKQFTIEAKMILECVKRYTR